MIALMYEDNCEIENKLAIDLFGDILVVHISPKITNFHKKQKKIKDEKYYDSISYLYFTACSSGATLCASLGVFREKCADERSEIEERRSAI